MRLLQYAFFALILSIGWMMLTEQFNLLAWAIGYVLSFGITAVLLHDRQIIMLDFAKVPAQIWALVVYTVVLARDILLSGIDVLLRVLGFRPVRPGIIAVKIHENDTFIAGMSAHGITITPGQLVVDFDDEGYLYVHCLDVEDSAPKVDAEQASRLSYLRAIRGKKR